MVSFYRILQGVFRMCGDLLGLLFPYLCCGCGIDLHRGEQHLCSKCSYSLPYTDYHLYPENRVARQFWGRIPFHAAMAMLYFRKGERVQHIIHNLKYKNQMALGVKLGMMIAERLRTAPQYQDIDLIIPVPLHRRKERTRGYNQSMCISEGIAAALNIPVNDRCLKKVLSTETQTNKKRYTRYENMKVVFKVADPALIANKHILLVDDVITTGATIEACATELNLAGISKLSIAAVAFTE